MWRKHWARKCIMTFQLCLLIFSSWVQIGNSILKLEFTIVKQSQLCPGYDFGFGLMLCVKRNECVNVSGACSIGWLIIHIPYHHFQAVRDIYSFIFSHLKSHSESFLPISSLSQLELCIQCWLECFEHEWMQGVATQTGNTCDRISYQQLI